MASIFKVEHPVVSGIVVAAVYVTSKDPDDDLLARTFGDVIINRSGRFTDPDDATFAPFIVDCGGPVGVFLNTLPDYKIKAVFDDQSLAIDVRMRQAVLWTDNMIAQIRAGLTALRLKTDTTGGDDTVSI